MNMDGSNLETISSAVFNPAGIALNVEKNLLYWSDRTARRVTRADLDGKNAVTTELPLYAPGALVLNKKGDFLFFLGEAITVGQSTPARIFKVPSTGGAVESIYRNSFIPQGFCIDTPNEQLYWTEGKSILRAELDGSNVSTIIDESASGTERYFGSIQIYTPENKVVPADSTLTTTYKLSPNPFHTSLRIEGLEEGDQVFIYSLLGHNYGGQKVGTSGEATILGQNLPSGMSYLYIRSKNGAVTSRKIYKY